MTKSYIYIVSDWMKTRCPYDCDQVVPFGPACPHQRWFPIPHRVVITFRDGKIIRTSCTEGKKATGVKCSKSNDDGNCKHIKDVIALLDSTLEDGREKSIDLSNILISQPKTPQCPHCKESWSVKPASITSKKRWHRKHKRQEMPEELWECRHPICRDKKGPWVFQVETQEQPSDKRHEVQINERIY